MSQFPNDLNHHTTNLFAAAAPFLSWSLSLPDAVTLVVGTLSAIYYTILIAEKIRNWRHK